jgi:hypothetical protein
MRCTIDGESASPDAEHAKELPMSTNPDAPDVSAEDEREAREVLAWAEGVLAMRIAAGDLPADERAAAEAQLATLRANIDAYVAMRGAR